MALGNFPLKKTLQIFGVSPADFDHQVLINGQNLPPFSRNETDNRRMKSWTIQDLPRVGKQIGFLPGSSKPLVVSIFVTKGGVLKTSLTMNLARLAALHGIRTCVVGLDMQGDITTTLAHDEMPDDDASLSDALLQMSQLRGLPDVFSGEAAIDEVVRATDLPFLSYIPETPELVALDQSLINKNRREYWLRDQVVSPLKQRFDLILLDCPPNWNRLITNALVACDVLLSPLECKINNFRNFKAFRQLVDEFMQDMRVDFAQIYVPTRLAAGRKLSREIHAWYRANLPECSEGVIRESLQGEEAMAMRLSVPEYAPTSSAAKEMRLLIQEIWSAINKTSQPRDLTTRHRQNPHTKDLSL